MMRARWKLYGRVQGVGFRWFAREAARALHLRGHVFNHPDGTVEVEAEGPPTAIAELRRTLAYGPPGAAVDRVEDCPPTGATLVLPFAIR
jgi:acylphosphatase